jgi:hypothetical protein
VFALRLLVLWNLEWLGKLLLDGSMRAVRVVVINFFLLRTI